jgi:hypothetical protein
LIKSPKRQDDINPYPRGNTKNIIEMVLYADARAAYYTAEFSPTLEGKDVKQTCRNIWAFVKTCIPYVLDKKGQQLVKSPGRLWKEKAGDCKSFSVFTASCLRNFGIPYGYRFASYNKHDETPTHVYIYVPLSNGQEIILDSVWDGPFNTQKGFDFKKDFLMRNTNTVSGIGRKGGIKSIRQSILNKIQNFRRRKPRGVLQTENTNNEITKGTTN